MRTGCVFENGDALNLSPLADRRQHPVQNIGKRPGACQHADADTEGVQKLLDAQHRNGVVFDERAQYRGEEAVDRSCSGSESRRFLAEPKGGQTEFQSNFPKREDSSLQELSVVQDCAASGDMPCVT